ncbi:hypothetical protein [Oceanobacillus halophilus]|uniref:hypothetical protein n=1 Tax=Oceanobacillus halophilus TaxID=930130 RepID=UPI001882F991|nr:hypothetical protein [Oceanobacillus halophilus]
MKFTKLLMVVIFVLILAGCIGEDYDVGVPTAHVQLELGLENPATQLTEANISWSSSSGEVEETVENIEEFGLSQEVIRVSPNQKATLDFMENEENGGDIWSNPRITATLWRDGESIDLELSDYREFRFPTNEGNYVLEVIFSNPGNRAQYVGHIDIQEKKEITIKDNEKLPRFSLMELPSIKKFQSESADGVVFNHSYTEVCWNDCNDKNTYNYSDIHAGDVEIGDQILIDWHKMNPQPTEVNLIEINTENNEEVNKVKVDSTNTPLNMEVDEQKMGVQYALEFLWAKGNNLKGKSVLDFKLE